MIPELAGKKIWIESEFESRIIQGLLFNAGYAWPSDFKKILDGVKFIRIGDSKTLSRTHKGKFDYTAFLEAPEKNIYLSTLKDLMPDIVKSYATGKTMKHPIEQYINQHYRLIGGFSYRRTYEKGDLVKITGLPFKSNSANGLSVPITTSDGKNIDIDIAFLFTPDVVDAVKRYMRSENNAQYGSLVSKGVQLPKGKEAIKSIGSQPNESIAFFTTWYADDRLIGKTYRLIAQNTEIMCVGKSNLYPNREGMIYQIRGEFYSFNAQDLINDIVTHQEFYDIFKHNANAASRVSTDLNEFTSMIPVKIKSETLTIEDSSGSITISESINDGTSIVMPNVTKVKANRQLNVSNSTPELVIPTIPVKAKKPKRPIYVMKNTLFIGTKRISN
jgi:hypothetical protein